MTATITAIITATTGGGNSNAKKRVRGGTKRTARKSATIAPRSLTCQTPKDPARSAKTSRPRDSKMMVAVVLLSSRDTSLRACAM